MVLAAAATLGRRPLAPWRWISIAIKGIFVVAALGATIAGLVAGAIHLELRDFFGYVYADLSLPGRLAFSQAAAIHETSYDTAGVATLAAAIIIFRRRRGLLGESSPEKAGLV